MPIIFKGSIEELINQLQVSIPISLRYLLELSLAGKPPPFLTFLEQATTGSADSDRPEARPAQAQNKTQLPAISESFEAQPPALFAWTFQHTSQVIGLTLRILFTRQIEASLKSLEDMRGLDAKFKALIRLYQQELCLFKVKKADVSAEAEGVTEEAMGLLINCQQQDKMTMIVNLLIFYRQVLEELIEGECRGVESVAWASKMRYYAETNADKEMNVVVRCGGKEVVYGFEYQAVVGGDVFGLEYRSEQVEEIMGVLVGMVQEKAGTLVHGNYVSFKYF